MLCRKDQCAGREDNNANNHDRNAGEQVAQHVGVLLAEHLRVPQVARPLHSHEAEGLTYAPPVVTPVLSLSARRRNRRRDVLTNAAGAMTHVDGFTARESGPHPFDLKFP